MINRTTEIKQLQKWYDSEASQLLLVYGNSRSEKEQLLAAFCKGKPTLYFRVRNASLEKQRKLLAAEIERQYGISLVDDSYEECFRSIRGQEGVKLVVVIDEIAGIVKKDPAFLDSIIQLKKGQLYKGDVLILLTTSSLTWVRKDMETAFAKNLSVVDEMMELADLSFLDVVRSLPDYSVAEAVQTYGIIGGVPAYLDRWDGSKTVKENVCSLFLDPHGLLHDEAETFISSELRELSVYDTILSTMAAGNEKLNDLYQETGYSRAKISVYLKNLAMFDVVEKVVSFETGGWENTKKGIYRIKNHFVNFWFRFVYPHLSDAYWMEKETFFDTYIVPGLDVYLRRYFVDVCKEYLALLNRVGKVPIRIRKMGTWIGKQGTIDVVGQDAVRDCVVGVTNWDAPAMTFDRYVQLLSDLQSARIHAKTVYLFSATSFDEKLVELEKDGSASVVLVDMTEL